MGANIHNNYSKYFPAGGVGVGGLLFHGRRVYMSEGTGLATLWW